ncbi:hypothetical protein ACS0TY_002046 [Phlomoides rotata]
MLTSLFLGALLVGQELTSMCTLRQTAVEFQHSDDSGVDESDDREHASIFITALERMMSWFVRKGANKAAAAASYNK